MDGRGGSTERSRGDLRAMTGAALVSSTLTFFSLPPTGATMRNWTSSRLRRCELSCASLPKRSDSEMRGAGLADFVSFSSSSSPSSTWSLSEADDAFELDRESDLSRLLLAIDSLTLLIGTLLVLSFVLSTSWRSCFGLARAALFGARRLTADRRLSSELSELDDRDDDELEDDGDIDDGDLDELLGLLSSSLIGRRRTGEAVDREDEREYRFKGGEIGPRLAVLLLDDSVFLIGGLAGLRLRLFEREMLCLFNLSFFALRSRFRSSFLAPSARLGRVSDVFLVLPLLVRLFESARLLVSLLSELEGLRFRLTSGLERDSFLSRFVFAGSGRSRDLDRRPFGLSRDLDRRDLMPSSLL